MMNVEGFGNTVLLLCTITGLLCCLFKYIEKPRQGYFYLIIFFLSHFFSDYYWTIYSLVMHVYPDVSEFVAYLGWNISYFFLFLAVFHMRNKDARHYFHPLMFWPVITNTAQCILYLKFGGILNTLWQVELTTAIMILCMQDIVYYYKNKAKHTKLPGLSVLILFYMLTSYGMWTVSCFDWSGGLKDPYLYFTLLNSVITLFFAWGAGKYYENSKKDYLDEEDISLQNQTLIQTIASFIILGGCAAGFFVAVMIRDSLPNISDDRVAADKVFIMLIVISAVLIFMVVLLISVLALRYNNIRKKNLVKSAV